MHRLRGPSQESSSPLTFKPARIRRFKPNFASIQYAIIIAGPLLHRTRCFFPIASTQCTDPLRDGQAEWASVAWKILEW